MSTPIININDQPYSPRLRCHFCRRNGHRYEDCHAHLLSLLYTCVQYETDFEIICFKIIRSFTIREISILYVAIREERGIAYLSNTNESFLHIVPVIANILLEEEEFVNIINNNVQFNNTEVNENQNQENIQFNENQENEMQINENQENEMQIDYETEEPQTEGEDDDDTESTVNMEIEDEEELAHFPPPAPVHQFEQSPIFTEFDTNIDLTNNHLHLDLTNDDFNFEDDEINTQFPLSLQNLSSNTNVMNQTMVLNNEDDYWPIPPLIDTSGNIVQFHQPFVNASGNNGYSSIPSLPIQITLNERIEIIPKNTCPVAEDPFCPICYENYEKNNIIKTECGHCFCFDCVKRFTKDNKKCPMCRGEILKLNVHMENLLL